jgi:Arc/MetJ-type ribon-helix-helix transcriptional regulator
MRRITISLPDDVAGIVQRDARRRHTSVSDVVRAALTSYLRLDQPRNLPFANLYRSGRTNDAERVEEILAAEWADAIYRDAFNRDP